MLSRRAFLGSALGAVALGAPILSSVAPALTPRASAAATLRTSVVNATGAFSNSAIKMYIPGVNLAGQQGFVNSSGVFVPVPQDAAHGTVLDMAIPLSNTGNTDFVLPKMSGRIYFAIDGELSFKAVVDEQGVRRMQYPAGWVESDDSYSVMHDCVEFTYNDIGMFCNTTMVDKFSVPLAIQLEGQASQTAGELVPGGRERIFSTVADHPDFANLVIGDKRVIAPGHGIDAGLFSPTYYDEYINEVWRKYSSTDLLVTDHLKSITYTGRVIDDVLIFDKGVAPIRKPSTRDVFFCDGALIAPNDGVTGPVAAMLGAAFNRGTLLDHSNQPITDTALHYNSEIANHYSRALHENTVDGKAYGFAFDDVSDLAAFIQDHNPSSWTITLTDLSSGPAPTEPGTDDGTDPGTGGGTDPGTGGGTDPGTGGGTDPGTGGGTNPGTGGGTNPGTGGGTSGSTGMNFGS
ncbi:beta-1,3-glucanase family protein [Rhodococcus sp. NPDC049939]|uniref:beta-1,3-glucanase family protein n=1 Tax=Rhodococcus sp. NPDC049939 TaxID=3155511 RepID=UPI0033E34D31